MKLLRFLGLCSVLCLASVNAQETTTNAPAPLTAQPNLLSQFASVVQSGGLLSAKNYAIEPYMTFAPKVAKGSQFGGGALVIYNVSDYVGAGLGIDYLGQFSLVSGNATLKLPINLGDKLGNWLPASWKPFASEVTVVPFVLAGIGSSTSGANTSLTGIADTGAYLQYGHLLGGKFNTGVAYGKWINAGPWSGERYHIFAGWSKGF